MIELKQTKKTFLSEITTLATADGFLPKLADQAFYRPEPFGKSIIHIGFIPHRNVDLDITVDVAIRIDAVETLKNERRTDLSAKASQRTATMGGDLGNLKEGRQNRWTIVSPDDTRQLAASIYSEIRSTGFDFFEQYSDMANVLKILSSLDPRVWWMSPGNAQRCKSAVALSFVLGGSDDIDAVVRSCESLLSERDSSALPDFFAFVANLRERMKTNDLPKIG